jgi:hypothetical protein
LSWTVAFNVSISRPVPERASSLSQTVPFSISTSSIKVLTQGEDHPDLYVEGVTQLADKSNVLLELLHSRQ